MKKIILLSLPLVLYSFFSSAQQKQHNTITVKKVERDSVFRELTPNGDGLNDFFNFSGSNIVLMKGTIVDEKGATVFETNKLGDKWDGKTKDGKNAKAGMYYFVMNASGRDGKMYEHKGTIKLIR